jgi:hypothetical protein
MTAATATRRHVRPPDSADGSWQGRTREYDLVKEFVIALLAVSVLTVSLAALFSSPDEKQLTLASWSRSSPQDFLATAATELDATSGSATYGAPYTHTPDAAQKLGPFSPQHLAGVTHPIDTINDFVVTPLSGTVGDSAVTAALATWKQAESSTQRQWAAGYDDALQKAPDADPAKVAAGDYGPVPVMLGGLLRLAQAGGLDGALLLQHSFYQSDYTKPLLFIADGTFFEDKAVSQHLAGDQWGMMNETGSYPGQAWLWLFSFWYQVEPFKSSPNADIQIFAIMGVLSIGLLLVPYLPGVRSIPRLVPLHRLIWRDYYRPRQ